MTSLETARYAAKALCERKGIDIKLIKISDISSIADYFVIAAGSSNTHVKSLADNVEFRLDNEGISVSHIEGYRSDSWILLDYVDVVVHVFSEEAREYYNLERLWEDGEEIDVSDIEGLPLEQLFPDQNKQ
ncbi:MAG: ribosome silencing factor [Clostridia bacterium]|nr:ribosome silencing factor [Clostridia bacterium]